MWRKRLEWAAIAAVVGGLSAVAWTSWVASQDRQRREAEAKVAAANYAAEAAKAAAAAKKRRPTFDLSPAELIDQYNRLMKDVDRSLLLPPLAAMADGGANPKFKAIQHEVGDGLVVAINIDIETGRPFDLHMGALGDGKLAQSVRIMALMSTIGATVFGKGEPAGVLLRTCMKAVDAKPPVAESVLGGFNVYCGATGGLWMGGISAPEKM